MWSGYTLDIKQLYLACFFPLFSSPPTSLPFRSHTAIYSIFKPEVSALHFVLRRYERQPYILVSELKSCDQSFRVWMVGVFWRKIKKWEDWEKNQEDEYRGQGWILIIVNCWVVWLQAHAKHYTLYSTFSCSCVLYFSTAYVSRPHFDWHSLNTWVDAWDSFFTECQ